MVAGVHFPMKTLAGDIGYKSLAVNLSDLAAMGATPLGAKVSLLAPNRDRGWHQAFHDGLNDLVEEFSLICHVETETSQDLVVTVQVYGEVPEQQALTRHGALPGDLIMVTGTLGDAGAGLACALGKIRSEATPATSLESRLNRPTPRVQEGLRLRGHASAAIDISDGLLADLGHLANASNLGANLDIDSIPLSSALCDILGSNRALDYALSSGDDYELLFTCKATRRAHVQDAIESLGTGCTKIGTMDQTPGIRSTTGAPLTPNVTGWVHFR
tara:strand:+ start:329 stop:1147 length:819 start_codon:yes stop_codon:yes gene_type:complete